MKLKIKPSEEIYGVEMRKYADLPYETVLKIKIKLARDQAGRYLRAQQNATNEEYAKLGILLNRSLKAISFNEELLKELE